MDAWHLPIRTGLLDDSLLHIPDVMKAIQNLKVVDGECMTSTDYKLREAIRIATENCLGLNSVKAKRTNGKITGYYVINEGGETALATID